MDDREGQVTAEFSGDMHLADNAANVLVDLFLKYQDVMHHTGRMPSTDQEAA